MFHPPRIGRTRRAEHQDLSLREVFQAPKLTPLDLSVVRTIRACVLQEKKDVLDVVSLITSQILDSQIIIRPTVSRNSTELRDLLNSTITTFLTMSRRTIPQPMTRLTAPKTSFFSSETLAQMALTTLRASGVSLGA